MELHLYEEAVYVISVASELLGAHPQTLRMYERKGLIQPKRTDTQQRLYSLRDLDDVREIRKLTREDGVNLAGVKEIIRLKRELEAANRRIAELEAQLKSK